MNISGSTLFEIVAPSVSVSSYWFIFVQPTKTPNSTWPMYLFIVYFFVSLKVLTAAKGSGSSN